MYTHSFQHFTSEMKKKQTHLPTTTTTTTKKAETSQYGTFNNIL